MALAGLVGWSVQEKGNLHHLNTLLWVRVMDAGVCQQSKLEAWWQSLVH